MYTCPDSSLYSAYVDGEVPSPWKEKLESHLTSCTKCKSKVDQYSMVSSILEETTPLLTAQGLELSYEKLLQKRAQRKLVEEFSFVNRIQNFTRTSIKLPVPAFAAILLAAIVLPSVYIANTRILVQTASANDTSSVVASMSLAQSPSQDFKKLTSTDIYSADPLPSNIASSVRVSSSDQLFSMIEYAKKFAADDALFASGDVIIIKLPELTQFETPTTTNQSMASFNK